jgi:hypothetical protein
MCQTGEAEEEEEEAITTLFMASWKHTSGVSQYSDTKQDCQFSTSLDTRAKIHKAGRRVTACGGCTEFKVFLRRNDRG